MLPVQPPAVAFPLATRASDASVSVPPDAAEDALPEPVAAARAERWVVRALAAPVQAEEALPALVLEPYTPAADPSAA